MDDPDPIPMEPLQPGPPPGPASVPLGMQMAQPVPAGVACAGCGYPLTGLTRSAKCPECGMEVERSLRGPMLRFAGSEYLRHLHLGVCLVLIANLLLIGVFVLSMAGEVAASSLSPGSVQWLDAATVLLNLLPTITGLVGYWYFTTPDPALEQGEQPRAARKVVRAMTIVQLAAAVLAVLGELVNASAISATAGSAAQVLTNVAEFVGLAAWVTAFFALMLYCRWLAMRVPDAEMMARGKMFMWLLPILVFPGCFLACIGPLVAFILFIVFMDSVRQRLKEALEHAREAERLTALANRPAFRGAL